MSFQKSFFILFFTIIFIACSSNSPLEDSSIKENDSIVQEIHQLINNHRNSIGKKALIFNDEVSKIALEHTNYMISKNKISHDNFNIRFTQLRKIVNAVSMAENVASHQQTGAEVVKDWINSNGHRKNIEENYTHTGIGVKKNSKGNYYFTQLFYSK